MNCPYCNGKDTVNDGTCSRYGNCSGAPKLSVDFFANGRSATKEYEGEPAAAGTLAAIEMLDHLERGGWCVLNIGNLSQMVTSKEQVLR